MYEKKNSQHVQVKGHPKKSFFDELWEKNHPEEAKQMQIEEEEKRKEQEKQKQEELAKQKEQEMKEKV